MNFEHTAHRPTLVLFCGLPGSGKTTTAKQLETSLPAIRLCTDDWLADLGADLFDEPLRNKLQLRLYELGKALLSLGQDVILEDGLWLRAERDEKRLAAAALGASTQLHYYDLSFDELWQRLNRRNVTGGHGTVPISREQLESYWPKFERPTEAELLQFDTYVIHT